MENNSSSTRKNETREKGSKKKITIEVDEDDPCLKKNKIHEEEIQTKDESIRTIGNDPRFQQLNQTPRCFIMYTDFYRCEHILGKGTEACTWFKDVFTSICPKAWVEQWDELRVTGRLPWHKYRTQGDFPGNKYGE
ncbi:CX6B1 oxidase, partial [Acromyrmex heyeri]